MGKVILHNPVAREPGRRANGGVLPQLGGSTLGVMENSNTNAVILIEALAETLVERSGVTRGSTVRFELNRPDEELFDEVAARNDWVLVGAAD